MSLGFNAVVSFGILKIRNKRPMNPVEIAKNLKSMLVCTCYSYLHVLTAVTLSS